MNRILLTAMMCVILSTVVDAAPRGRRAARRRTAQLQQQRTVSSQQRSTTSQYYRASNGRYYYYSRSATRPQTTTSTRVASTSTASTVTSYNPVVPTTTAPEPSTTQVAMATVSPIATSAPADAEMVQATAVQPLPDVMPRLKVETTAQPYCASCQMIPAGASTGSALAELNGIRASRGLPALVEDPSLTAIAYQKASIQANARAMYHPGGSMGSARFEGVGMGPRFTTCYQDATNVRYAGAATVTAANGQRYHCLLVR